MHHRLTYLPLLCLLSASAAVPAPAMAAPESAPAKEAAAARPEATQVISTGKETILVDHLQPEKPTVVLFFRPAVTFDAELAATLGQRVAGDDRVGLRLVRLPALDAPIAKQYEVDATPVAFVYDRNKNLLGRGKTPQEIGALVGGGLRTARIKWIDETDPKAAQIYRMFGGGRQPVPEIMKTMSLQPEWMEAIAGLAQRAQFSDSVLNRRTKEMIASYVSSLNKCKY